MHSSEMSSFMRLEVTMYFTFFLEETKRELLEVLFLRNSERGVLVTYDGYSLDFNGFDALATLYVELGTSIQSSNEVSSDLIEVY